MLKPSELQHDSTPATEDSLPKFTAGGDGPKDSGVLFVQVTAATAEQWLKAEGRDLHQIWSAIDRDQKPQSFALSKLRGLFSESS